MALKCFDTNNVSSEYIRGRPLNNKTESLNQFILFLCVKKFFVQKKS